MVTLWLVEPETQFAAGTIAPAGYYCRVDVRYGSITLHRGGPLPASCDGQRASYARVQPCPTPGPQTTARGRGGEQ